MAGWLDKAEKILISASLALAWADLDKNLVKKIEKKKLVKKLVQNKILVRKKIWSKNIF